MRRPDDRMVARIASFLEHNEQAMIDFLTSLVVAESPSRNKFSQDLPMSIISSELEKDGLYCLRQKGHKTGGFLYARPSLRKKAGVYQLLIGHCDTVWPLGTIEGMPLMLRDNQIAGPGIYDMKAGLTQIVFAWKCLRKLAYEPELMPLILINSDEEIGSRESTACIKRLARLSNRAYVLEPPLGLDGKLKTARKGISRFTITIRGKAAHAGLDPEKGRNAIVEMTHVIQKLFGWNDPIGGITVNVGTIEGGVSANVVAPMSKIHVDVRVLHQDDMRKMSARIHGLTGLNPGFSITVEESPGRPPMERTERNRRLWKLARETGSRIDLSLQEATAGGGSDGNTTSLYTATIDGLGTTGDGAHASHEFIFRQQLTQRTLLLSLLLMADPLLGQTHG